MRNNGINTRISPRSRPGPGKINGKKRSRTSPASSKKPLKYTIVRTNQDIHELEKLRRVLKDRYGISRYNTDAEIYRDLPSLYLDAVKHSQDLDHQVEVLTAELGQLQQLKDSFCRCIELSKEKRKP